MARVRNNQGHRAKILNVFMRPYLEQENTQEREGFLDAREKIKPLKTQRGNLPSKLLDDITHRKMWKWHITCKTNFQT